MKRILIPTDFSDISKNSINYGINLAQELGSHVSLIHILELYKYAAGTSETEILSTILPPENIREMELAAENNFDTLINDYKKAFGPGLTIDHKVVTGQLVNEVLSEALLQDTVLIVLGVSSKQDLFTRFNEGTVSAIIKDASCPILVVPSERNYQPWKKIIFATDFKKAELDAYSHLYSFLNEIKPSIKLLHITPKQPIDFSTELKMAGFRQLLADKHQIAPVGYKIISHKNIVNGIIDALKNEEADLLVMLKGHESFFKSLFETSRTEKITHYLKIPMISYHEDFKHE